MLRFGLQIQSFTFPGLPAEQLFDRVAEVATVAEESGFDSIWVMDHMRQIGALGGPTCPMLDAYTLLAGLAGRTSRVRLGALVTGVTYRHPSLLAKVVTTLDVVSRGRAILGIGAAWDQEEHEAYGIPFPPSRERLDRLEEAIQVCQAMFTQETASFEGRYYQLREAACAPRPVQSGGPPILVGGGGEQRTLRLVARYADICNLIGDLETVRGKLQVLDRHCQELGVDPARITRTRLGPMVIGRTHEEAERKGAEYRAAFGVDQESYRRLVLAGDPAAVAEQVQAYFDAGLDGLILGLHDPQDLEAVELAGQVVGPFRSDR